MVVGGIVSWPFLSPPIPSPLALGSRSWLFVFLDLCLALSVLKERLLSFWGWRRSFFFQSYRIQWKQKILCEVKSGGVSLVGN